MLRVACSVAPQGRTGIVAGQGHARDAQRLNAGRDVNRPVALTRLQLPMTQVFQLRDFSS